MVGEGRTLQLNTPMTGIDAEQRQIEAARRDPNAFAPLYASYFDPIYRYCYLRCTTGSWLPTPPAKPFSRR